MTVKDQVVVVETGRAAGRMEPGIRVSTCEKECVGEEEKYDKRMLRTAVVGAG